MNYISLRKQIYTYENFSIVPLREEDIYSIKEWRNQQIDILRQKRLLTDEDQKNYYTKSIIPSFTQSNPDIILFSFLEKDKCIGYGGLTNIDWESKRTELSFLVDPTIHYNEQRYVESFSAYITLIKKVMYEDIEFNRVFTETYDIRPLHISILEKNGFIYEGRMKEHVMIGGQYVDSLIHGYLKEYYHVKK